MIGQKVPGGTVYVKIPPHKCDPPPADAYSEGDEFHCDCGEKFTVEVAQYRPPYEHESHTIRRWKAST